MGQSACCEQARHLGHIHVALAIAYGIHTDGMPVAGRSGVAHVARTSTSAPALREHRVKCAFERGLQRGTGLQRCDDRREHDADAACRLTRMVSHARFHRLQAP